MAIGKGNFKLSSIDLIRLHSLPKNATARIQTGGHNLEILNAAWSLVSFKEIFEEEVYLFESQNQTPFIVDCGSNIGLSILYFKSLYPEARIIGFEPDPQLYQILTNNISEFSLHNVEIFEKAIWIENAKDMPFQRDMGWGGKLTEYPTSKSTVLVDTLRLKDLISQQIDLLKVDIEGAEFEVFTDIQHHLDFINSIFVEYHGKAGESQKLGQLLNILQNAHFRYYIKEAKSIRHPFVKSERGSDYDLQLNIFAYRV